MSEEFILKKFLDQTWYDIIDLLIDSLLIYVGMFSAFLCALLLLVLDASHFLEYKILAFVNVLYGVLLVCDKRPQFYQYNRRVFSALCHKIVLCSMFFAFRSVWLNEERVITVARLIGITFMNVLSASMAAFFLFLLSSPLTWLAIHSLSGKMHQFNHPIVPKFCIACIACLFTCGALSTHYSLQESCKVILQANAFFVQDEHFSCKEKIL